MRSSQTISVDSPTTKAFQLTFLHLLTIQWDLCSWYYSVLMIPRRKNRGRHLTGLLHEILTTHEKHTKQENIVKEPALLS